MRARLLLVGGIVLIIVGIFDAATFGRLVMAYMAKPDAANGGLQFGSTFVKISSPLADIGLLLGIIGIVFGIVMIWRSRIRTPIPVATTLKQPQTIQ